MDTRKINVTINRRYLNIDILKKELFFNVTKLSDNIEGQIIFKKFIKNI